MLISALILRVVLRVITELKKWEGKKPGGRGGGTVGVWGEECLI